MSVILLYVCWISGTQLSPTLQREVKGIVGESVTFPSVQVSRIIDLKQGDSATTIRTVAGVINGTITDTQPDFKDRVTWDNQSGFFQIRDLRTNDSGVYTVESLGTQQTSTIFNLTVYNRVSRPQVSRVSQGSESCSLLCSVSNGREVTLSWQREGETLTNTSNPDLNTPLTLPLETEGLSHSYSCVASNPVSNETLPVRPEEHCFGADDRVLLYAGAAGGGAVCLGIVALVLYCRLRGKKPRDEDSSPTNNGALGSGPAEVTYAALDMKRLKKPTSVPPAGEDHTVYAEVTGGGRMQGSHFAPEPPPAAGTLASECTEYARVNFRRKTRRAQDAVLYY